MDHIDHLKLFSFEGGTSLRAKAILIKQTGIIFSNRISARECTRPESMLYLVKNKKNIHKERKRKPTSSLFAEPN